MGFIGGVFDSNEDLIKSKSFAMGSPQKHY